MGFQLFVWRASIMTGINWQQPALQTAQRAIRSSHGWANAFAIYSDLGRACRRLSCSKVKDFYMFYFLRVCIMTDEKQSEQPIPPCSCLFPPLCKTGISKDTLVPKQSAVIGGALSGQRSAHPRQVGITGTTFPTATTHGELWRRALLTDTQKYLQCPLYGRYFLSMAWRQVWKQWLGLLSQLLEK